MIRKNFQSIRAADFLFVENIGGNELWEVN